jgi:hypothetical protein
VHHSLHKHKVPTSSSPEPHTYVGVGLVLYPLLYSCLLYHTGIRMYIHFTGMCMPTPSRSIWPPVRPRICIHAGAGTVSIGTRRRGCSRVSDSLQLKVSHLVSDQWSDGGVLHRFLERLRSVL